MEFNIILLCSSKGLLIHLLAAKTDKAFKAFLDARNPTKQHSSTLESYLIKPVQRVLKYPLLLKELVSLTDHESEEHYHLTGKKRGPRGDLTAATLDLRAPLFLCLVSHSERFSAS